MYSITTTNRFEKQLKLCIRRGFPMAKFKKVVSMLEMSGSLPARYRPHKLSGRYSGCWECHIQPDWLLVWEQDDNELRLLLTGTGTHSDLFGE